MPSLREALLADVHDEKRVDGYYLPVAEWLAGPLESNTKRPYFLGISGPQGSGKPNYQHTPEDTLDKVSAQSLKIVGDVAYSLITGAQD